MHARAFVFMCVCVLVGASACVWGVRMHAECMFACVRAYRLRFALLCVLVCVRVCVYGFLCQHALHVCVCACMQTCMCA